MHEFFKSKQFKVLLIVVACLSGLITFEIFSDDNTIFKSTLKTVLQPIIKTTNFINDSVNDFFDDFFRSGQHKEENQLLKKEIAKNRKLLVEFDELRLENDQLKKALNFKKENSEYEIEMANFVSKDPDSISTFTIDIGNNKQIPLGAVVLTNMGLVGKITKVEQNQSVVTTILNLDDKIPATVNLKQEKGLVCGDVKLLNSGMCVMSHLPKTTSAAPGDLVYTTGANNAYPADIVIGTIVEISLNENGISKEAIIRPAQNLNEIKEVIVIKKYLGKSVKID